MKTALRFFIYTSTCVLIGYLGGLALGVDLEKNKAPEKDKGCRVSTPDEEEGIDLMINYWELVRKAITEL